MLASLMTRYRCLLNRSVAYNNHPVLLAMVAVATTGDWPARLKSRCMEGGIAVRHW